jgi:RNA polymerase sigma-B factor
MTPAKTALPTAPRETGTPMSPTSEALLFARHVDGDQAAREALVRRFMPLARSLARRYDRSSEPFEDLLQVASLGLLKALDRFDPTLGHPFASFAVPTILGEMRRHFRDAGWSVHVPRGSQERALKVRDAQERLANAHGRAPDAPRPGATDEATSYGDAMGEEDARYELVELDATVSAVLGRIPAREREILRMRFVEDLTQTEIAERVGISQMQVSRLLRRSLDQLRALTATTS